MCRTSWSWSWPRKWAHATPSPSLPRPRAAGALPGWRVLSWRSPQSQEIAPGGPRWIFEGKARRPAERTWAFFEVFSGRNASWKLWMLCLPVKSLLLYNLQLFENLNLPRLMTLSHVTGLTLSTSKPHEPRGPLDARLRGEVNQGVAVGGQYVWAWQGAELLPPETNWILIWPHFWFFLPSGNYSGNIKAKKKCEVLRKSVIPVYCGDKWLLYFVNWLTLLKREILSLK